MKIGEIGNTFKSTINIQYLSDQTFIDFDFLILDYAYVLNQALVEHGNAFIKRKEKVEEYIRHKKIPLIIFAPEPIFLPLNIKGNTRLVKLDELLPVQSFNVEKETGSNINIVSNTIFTDFLLKYKPFFHYTSYFSEYNGKVIIDVPYTKKVLSFYNDTSIFIPRLKANIAQHESDFLAELTAIATNVNAERKIETLPKWSSQYLLPFEGDIQKQIKSISSQITELNTNLHNAEKQLSDITRKKNLFTGTGIGLETEIKRIFEDLGFEIMESDTDRDDLTIKYQAKIAVVEIKGVNGSAAEKYAAQLEKWVSIYHEKNNIVPKGILIVNSFRDEELSKRSLDTFPHQMLNYCEKREHCLISAVQLLCIYFEIQKNQGRKQELINSLFDTIGVYKYFHEWKDYIEVLPSIAPK